MMAIEYVMVPIIFAVIILGNIVIVRAAIRYLLENSGP